MKFIDSILRGIGQVIFQNNIYSGILFIIGIFYNSWIMGLAALIGTIISTITAQSLKYSEDDIKNGLYGFNGTLTGIAVLCFFEFNLITAIALVLNWRTIWNNNQLYQSNFQIIQQWEKHEIIVYWCIFEVITYRV